MSFTDKRTTKTQTNLQKDVFVLFIRTVLGYSSPDPLHFQRKCGSTFRCLDDEGRLVIYFCCSFHACSPLLSPSIFVVCSPTAAFCFACVISRKIPKESLLGFGTIIDLRQVLFLDLICSLFFQFIFIFFLFFS